MEDIKIFVSHRIDIESELIDNPVYVPVRCGAVFDEQNPMKIKGDNTGNHISEKRMSFCEFTVQYWAWKNEYADYYGLCHYRRFLSFAEKRYKTNEFNMVYEPMMMPWHKKKYGLLNEKRLKRIASEYDLITSEYADVRKIPSPIGQVETVRELWEAHDNYFFEKSSIELMFQLIDKLAPEYSISAREYFMGHMHRGFNCFVMKRELFERLCEFQFPILFELEKMLDTGNYSQTMKRTPGFIGEMLYGIFIYHISENEDVKIKEVQLVFFNNTDKINSKTELLSRCFYACMDKLLRLIIDPFFPIGSRRREKMKRIYYKVTHAKKRGVAEIKR